MATTKEDVRDLLRAQVTLLWVVTREERRVERALAEAATEARRGVGFWDCADGFSRFGSDDTDRTMADPMQVLERFDEARDRRVLIMRDAHKWLDPIMLRKLRSSAKRASRYTRTIIILTPSSDVPPELADLATVIEWPIPTRAEIEGILRDAVAALPEGMDAKVSDPDAFAAAVDAAIGLSAEEAAGCYALSLVKTRRIDPAMVASEKRRVIAREKVLTWYDPDPRGLDAVGGLGELKGWLGQRRAAFSSRAAAFGLPPPKGCLIVGVPGTGKSLTAKAVAAAWQVPLLRLDMGALKSKWIGESEANIRKALSVAETVAPCVLWLDEIEKALGGSTSPQGDGGVSTDALGAVLSWMQERKAPVFVVATANDVRSLPPELLRKGRFDELWWVDLPRPEERAEIIVAALAQYGRTDEGIATEALVAETDGFTGAEIAAMVPEALFAAFGDGERDLTTDDLMTAARNVVPLSRTAADKLEELRSWAKGRARNATAVERSARPVGRTIDTETV